MKQEYEMIDQGHLRIRSYPETKEDVYILTQNKDIQLEIEKEQLKQEKLKEEIEKERLQKEKLERETKEMKKKYNKYKNMFMLYICVMMYIYLCSVF